MGGQYCSIRAEEDITGRTVLFDTGRIRHTWEDIVAWYEQKKTYTVGHCCFRLTNLFLSLVRCVWDRGV